MLKRVLSWVALLIAVALLYGVNLAFPRDLWVQDEARYGEIVREMASGGSWFVPTLDGQFYPDKPPLYFWLLAAQARSTGLGMLSFRLVGFASALAFAGAFFVFARRLLGESRALWAVLIALTTQLFLITGNIVRMDILLAALVTLSLHFLLRAVDEDRPRLALAGYAFALAATMVKGPLGFAFPVLGAVPYAFWSGRFKGLARLRLPSGALLAVAVGVAWTASLLASGHAAYVQDVLVKQLWGRSVGSWSHPQPPYFYAVVLLPLFMPWLPYLPRAARGAEGVRLVALSWFLPGFGLISAISGKLFVYMVPLFPPLALLVAAALPPPWEAIEDGHAEGQGPSRLAGALSGLFFAAAGAGMLYALERYLGGELWHLAPAAGVVLAVGVILVLLALRAPARVHLCGLLVASVALSWVLLGWGAAQLNGYFSARELGERLAAAKQAGWQPAAVDIARGTLSFYAGCEVRQLSASQLGAALSEPGRLAVVVRRKKLSLIPKDVLARLAPVAEFPRLEFDGYTLYYERTVVERTVVERTVVPPPAPPPAPAPAPARAPAASVPARSRVPAAAPGVRTVNPRP